MAANEMELPVPEPADPSLILEEWERILLYGDGGTGKTFIAATAPEPQWWLTPGGRNELKTAYSKRFLEKHGRKQMFITSVKEDRQKGQMSDNPSGYDRCCDAVDGFLEWNDKTGAGVKSIIVDNATVLEEYMMNKAINAEYILAPSKDKTVLRTERDFGIRKPHKGTYGAAQSFMTRWVSWLKELPFHLIFVAHARYEWEQADEYSGSRKLIAVLPEFVGAQRVSVPNAFDSVWLTTVSGGGRSLTYGVQSERDEIRYAKTRVGGILDPTYERDLDLAEVIAQFSDHAHALEQEK